VAPRNGDLQRPPRFRLAPHVREIRPALIRRRRDGPCLRLLRDELGPRHRAAPAHTPASDQLGGLAERRGRQRDDPGHQAGFVERVRRYHHAPGPAPGEGRDHRQQPGHRPDLPAEPQLPQQRPPAPRVDLLRADQDGDRDPQVQRRARLGDIRGGEVDGDAPGRMDEPGVAQRATDPLARLAQGGIGEADDGEARQARGDVHLDPNRATLEAAERCGEHRCQHGGHASPGALSRDQSPLHCSVPADRPRRAISASWSPRLPRPPAAAPYRWRARSRGTTGPAASPPSRTSPGRRSSGR
jgi:hypothetical protein